MNGVIGRMNSERKVVAVLTQEGDYSIFELSGGADFEQGDEGRSREDPSA